MYRVIILMALIFSILYSTKSAKILGIFPIQSRSHQSIHESLINGLAARGHDITVISHFKLDNLTSSANYQEILFTDERYIDFKDSIDIEERADFVGIDYFSKTAPIVDEIPFEDVVNLEYIKKLINSKGKDIDLIITEVYATQLYHLLAHKLNVSLVLVSPMNLTPKTDRFIGHFQNPSTAPFIFSPFTTKMNFFQRLLNTYYHAKMYWCENYVYNEVMKRYARDVFNMELPLDEELNKRTALALYNSHFSFISRPTPPNAINIAGIHIKEAKQLPQDIEDFISGSDHGVILFSFGSTIRANSISAEKLEIIKKVFSAIPQRVLWRINELNMTGMPLNVKMGKWFPQRDILEHKNVIGFISHCGLLGIWEAIHTATPIIAIPMTFDQPQNANLLHEREVGIRVDYSTMDDRTLLNAINEIVINPKYRENMKRLSREFRDRPISPLDEAMYWVEYVLKYQGASHLRTESADMPSYQYLWLDVLLLILAVIIGIVYFCKFLCKVIIVKLCRQRTKKNKI